MCTATIALISWIIGGPAVLYVGICIGSGAARRRIQQERRYVRRRKQASQPHIVQAGRKVIKLDEFEKELS